MTTYRTAGPADAAAIAALHADSWRRHYRGAYSDTFLDGDVVTDRLAVWTTRLGSDHDGSTVVAEDPGRLTGFVHVVPGHDPAWGALVDNLHVAHDRQRAGLGRALLHRAATEVGPGRPVYLWVLEQNRAARRFYTALGGTIAERTEVTGAPPGVLHGVPIKLRVVWPDAATLLRADTAENVAGRR